MLIKNVTTVFLMSLVMLLVACAPEPELTPIAVASDATGTASPTPGVLTTPEFWPCEGLTTAKTAEEILRLSGNAPFSSEAWNLAVETTIRIYWNQASGGQFILKVVNTDPAQMGTPYGEVTFESFMGVSSGCSDYIFIPGDYKVIVEEANGPWEVWVQAITP